MLIFIGLVGFALCVLSGIVLGTDLRNWRRVLVSAILFALGVAAMAFALYQRQVPDILFSIVPSAGILFGLGMVAAGMWRTRRHTE